MSLARDPCQCPLLISYPHSGNSWVRYAAETVTKHPSFDAYDGRVIRPDYVDLDACPVLVKYHNMDNLNEDDRHRKLVVLIRDPRECIGSRLHRGADKGRKEYIRDEAKKYMKILAEAGAWPSPALVLHYEDIIIQPHVIFPQLFSALDMPVGPEAAESFIKNIDSHFEQSRSSFIMGAISDPKSIHWHARRLGEENLKSIVEEILSACRESHQLLTRYGFSAGICGVKG